MWNRTKFLTHIKAVSYRHESTNPGTPKEVLDKIIRVDHAGELGADRIYAGQMAILGRKYLNYLKIIKL